MELFLWKCKWTQCPTNTNRPGPNPTRCQSRKSISPNQTRPLRCSSSSLNALFWASKGIRFEAVEVLDLCVSSSTWHWGMNWNLKNWIGKGFEWKFAASTCVLSYGFSWQFNRRSPMTHRSVLVSQVEALWWSRCFGAAVPTSQPTTTVASTSRWPLNWWTSWQDDCHMVSPFGCWRLRSRWKWRKAAGLHYETWCF